MFEDVVVLVELFIVVVEVDDVFWVELIECCLVCVKMVVEVLV